MPEQRGGGRSADGGALQRDAGLGADPQETIFIVGGDQVVGAGVELDDVTRLRGRDGVVDAFGVVDVVVRIGEESRDVAGDARGRSGQEEGEQWCEQAVDGGAGAGFHGVGLG